MSNSHIQKIALSDRARHDSYFSERSPRISHEYFPPESLLTRSNMINADRSRQMHCFLAKSSKKDISYLIDSLSPRGNNLSPLLPSSTYPLPSEISELQLLLDSDDYSIENIFKRAKYSKPYGRTDAINLATWLEDMHNKYLSKLDFIIQGKDFVDREMAKIVERIYLIALKESIKQISVHCIERAAMLHRIFDILKYTWKKTPDDFSRKVNLLNNKFNEDLKAFKSKYKVKYKHLMKNFQDLQETNEKVKKENELLKNSQSILSQRLKQVKEDNELRKIDGHLQIRKTKIMAEVCVQTDEIEFDKHSEGSSSDSSQAIIAETERIFTRQQTIANEKRGEHLNHLRKHIDLAKCSGEFVIEDLYQYINSEYLDFYGWVDGFRLAAEILNSREKSLEVIQKTETATEDPQIEEKNPESKPEEKKKPKEPSKGIQFKPGITIAKYLSENAPVDIIIEQLECLRIKKIEKISRMAYKKLSNSIQTYLTIARSKPAETAVQSFSIFVYSYLFHKYSMQQPIVDRKFKELVASCIKYSSEPKVQIFLRMIGAGKNLQFPKFFPTTNKMCLKIYEFMYSDKTGIVLENAGQPDNNNFPLARALECIKQLFEPIYLRYELVKLKKQVETLMMQDPDSLNRSGVVDIHQFLLAALQSYQEFSERIHQGVKSAVDIISGYHYLTWEEANVLIRNISPKINLTESERGQITMSQTYEIEIEDFFLFCLSKGLLRIDDYHRFFSRRPPSVAEITEKIKEVKEVLEDVVMKAQGHLVTLSFEEWNGKLDDIVVELKSNKQDHGSKLWVLFLSEYQKLDKINN